MNDYYPTKESISFSVSEATNKLEEELRALIDAIYESTKNIHELEALYADVWLEDRALPLRPPRKIFPRGLHTVDKRGDIRRRLRCVKISMQ